MTAKKMFVLVVVVLGVCLLSMQGASATIQVFTDESEFLLTANIASTETFDGYSSGVLGTGTVVVDGITYIGQEPTWDWYITPYSGVNPPALFSHKSFGLNGGSDVLTFAGGAWTECIGFHFLKGSTSPGSSKVQWVVVATDSDGQQVTVPVLLDEPYVSYVGFIATSGIVSVSVTDVPDESGVSWAYDNVSRGQILPAPAIIYVDVNANGANDGSSWVDAYNYLQDALADANSNVDVNEIWVAEGIYTPDSNTTYPDGTGEREATFQLINGVVIKGGYAGFAEPDPNARDVELYETILSGDLYGDDEPNFYFNDENSYHVVTGSGTDPNAILDGFTITAGNASGGYGGGMYNRPGSPTVANCTFSGNSASQGGGGVANDNDSRPTLTNCLFSGNWAGHHGGGLANGHSNPTLTNCTFSGNEAGAQGGGMNNWESRATVTNCILWGNTAPKGAQIYNDWAGSATVSYSDIESCGGSGAGWDPNCGIDDGNNIDADPCFVAGPLGDFYLSQVAAGQLVDSPCVDAGSDWASVFGLDEFTTRTDHVGDTGIVDMGYHYVPPANTQPVACIVGGDRTEEAGSGCEARVVLDGSCSSDVDSTPGTNDDINNFDWYKVIDACDPNGEVFLGTGEIIDCNLPLGEHIIILEVTDKADAFDSNEVTITVKDTTPPEFDLAVEPNVLWPANHKMIKITPNWTTGDNCDESPDVTLVSITMNEHDDGKGDGHTSDDIQISANGSIYLRAERSGTGTSRIYTITYQVVDDSGNITLGGTTVTVPHDKRRAK